MVYLAEGHGVWAVACIKGVNKDTVVKWLEVAFQHAEASPGIGWSACILRKRNRTNAGTLFKKEAHCTAFEPLQTEYGDGWIWIRFDPVPKGIPAFVPGEIHQENADQRIVRTKAVTTAPSTSFSTTSGLNTRRRFRNPLVNGFSASGGASEVRGPSCSGCPPDLLYAQMVKHRRKSRVVKVTTRVVLSTPEGLEKYLQRSPASRHVHTADGGTAESHNAPANRRFTRSGDR